MKIVLQKRKVTINNLINRSIVSFVIEVFYGDTDVMMATHSNTFFRHRIFPQFFLSSVKNRKEDIHELDRKFKAMKTTDNKYCSQSSQ